MTSFKRPAIVTAAVLALGLAGFASAQTPRMGRPGSPMYDLKTGKLVDMPSGYDEFSERASPDYTGGTTEQRANRDLLRRLMEDEGFVVDANEWWHFDFEDWEKYAIYDISFDEASQNRER